MNGWLEHLPSGWDTIQPRSRFRERREPSRPDDEHLTPSQHLGVLTQREYMERTGSRVVLNLSGADKMKHVEPGDFIAHLRSFQGGLETSALRGKVSTAYTVMRAIDGAHHPYFRWVFKSHAFIGELASTTQQLRDGQTVRFQDIGSLRLPLPPEPDQRRIADFLDDRVSRIDRIIAARQIQLSAHTELTGAQVERLLDQAPDKIRASRVLHVLPGFAFPSRDFSHNASDIPLLRGINVGISGIVWNEAVYWPSNRANEVEAFRLEPGDIVIGMDRPWIRGGLRLAVVREIDRRPLLLQRVAKITPRLGLLPEYALVALRSVAFRSQIEQDLTGLSVPHLSGEQVNSFVMPYGPLTWQRTVADSDARVRQSTHQATAALTRSIDLLTEYKQSLITAAVTGQLDVTTASTRIPE